ncbi:MAG: hypothetical protein ACK4LQ_12065 [Pararhodobacter sp.]
MREYSHWRGLAVLVLVGVMGGCASPLERCLAEAGREVALLEQELTERRVNIARGHALHREVVVDFMPGLCFSPLLDAYRTCMEPVERLRETRRAINVGDERERIAQLERSLARERAQAERARAQCVAQFPASPA